MLAFECILVVMGILKATERLWHGCIDKWALMSILSRSICWDGDLEEFLRLAVGHTTMEFEHKTRILG
jgi:hypothetical protein